MTAPFHIRPAGAADRTAIQRIEAAAFEPSRRSSARSLRRALVSPFQRVLVLEANGTLAGYLVIWPFSRTWRIYNLATDPGWRNRGVAAALMAAAVADARRAGARRVVLESRTDPPLVRYYERQGFRTERQLPDYYAEGEDAVRMVLDVAPAHDRLP